MTMNSNDDPLFAKSDPVAASLLDRAYSAQVRFFFPGEFSVFRRCRSWQAADRILDVGTGNGYFIQRLARAFRTKDFTAIDTDDTQLAIARATNIGNIAFLHVEASEVSGIYDAILLRFVAQHLQRLSYVVGHLRGLLRRGGTMYVTEGCDALTVFDPEPKLFREIFRSLANQRKQVGADLDVEKKIPAVAKSTGLSVVEIHEVRSSTADHGGLERMLEMELAILAYLKYVNVVEGRYADAAQELISWYSVKDSYGEETLKIFKLQAE